MKVNGKPGISDYKFGAKKRWRKDVWREIARRTNNKRKAKILYLAGEQDLDRAEAIKHKFNPANMIAIEIDKGRTAVLRKNGVTTINGNLMDVLYNWPEKHRIDVIVADFCFGFETQSIDLFDSLPNPALRNSCVLINFQRGRDSSTNKIRKALNGCGYWGQTPAGEPVKIVDAKHRAFQYLAWHAYEYSHMAKYGKTEGYYLDEMKDDMFALMVSATIAGMKPTFRSYKSGRIYMDSAVFNHNFKNANLMKLCRTLKISDKDLMTRYAPPDDGLKKKITAALAVQTRRASA